MTGTIDRNRFSHENGAFEAHSTDSIEPWQGSAPPSLWRDPGLLTFIGAGAVLVIGWLTALSGSRELSVAAYLVATIVGACLFMRLGLSRLFLRRQVTLDLWIGLAIVGCLSRGEFGLGAFIAVVYSITQAGGSLSVGDGLD